MERLPFRDHHLLRLLNGYGKQNLPLDLYTSKYFRANKALGSKDREEIAETIYGMIRWKGLLDYLCRGKETTWERRLEIFRNMDLLKEQEKKPIPTHTLLSFPNELYLAIRRTHGPETAKAICMASNQPAPTTIRVNLLKTSREQLLGKLKENFKASPCAISKTGIQFHKKINFFSLPEFQAGLFEVQDEGSQLLADLVDIQPGEQFLDYCSGSGGKSLAIAPKMQNKGQIYLHDIRCRALQECTKRLRRAGVQNAQILSPDEAKHKRLKKKMDWVLVDAPCSGTGTLRRNPDMKWKWSEEMLERLAGRQRMIFEKALSYTKPGGKIVYGTCSILKEENQEQVEHFLNTYPVSLTEPPFQSIPQPGEMDGFFGAVFQTALLP